MESWLSHWFTKNGNVERNDESVDFVDSGNIIEDTFESCHFDKVDVARPIVHLIGNTGIGKKHFMMRMSKKYNMIPIEINTILDTTYSIGNKNTFLQNLENLMTHQGIEYFLTGKKKVIIVHGMHLLKDKKLYDEIFDICETRKILAPVICLMNKSYVSERLITFLSKRSNVYILKPKGDMIMRKVLEDWNVENGIELTEEAMTAIIKKAQGNFYYLGVLWRDAVYTFYENMESDDWCDIMGSKEIKGCDTDGNEKHEVSEKLNLTTKNTIEHAFRVLCDRNIRWVVKEDVIKMHGSLLKLLMSKHVCGGIDKMHDKSFDEKLDVGLKCMRQLSEGETLGHSGTNSAKELAMYMCWVYPTLMVDHVTIKTMVLPNYPSTINLSSTKVDPYTPDNTLYIAYVVHLFLTDCLTTKEYKGIEHYYERLEKGDVYEMNYTYFKLFTWNETLSKKKINIYYDKLNY